MPYGVQTPILVPSFSSKGFPDVADIFDQVRDEITECSLLSAYCLTYCEALRNGNIYASDLLFIDSGGYECKELLEADGEAYRSTLIANTWNPDHYSRALRELTPMSQLVIVTYDDNEYPPLSEQISRADKLLETYNNYAIDFLLKPEHLGDTINVSEVGRSISSITRFSILGIVEQELGASLLDRCRTVLHLRMLLMQEGCDIPIHIFGSLDPLRSVLYFLCGADVFDGLAWLRYSFRSGLGRYMAQAALIDKHLTRRTDQVTTIFRMENLDFFRKLEGNMQRFASTHDFKDLTGISEWSELLLTTLEEVGIHL